MTKIANRLLAIKPSPTMAVTAKSEELKKLGHNVISLGVGEPDFDTPDFVKDGAKKAIDAGYTKYTPVPGTSSLRMAIARKFKNENSLDYSIEEICVGCGGKQTLYNAAMATINPTDEVIIPAPYWVSYPPIVELAEGTPVIVDCPEEDGFKLRGPSLEKAITDKTKWIILNSPSNPTGMAYTKEELREIADVLLKHPHVGIWSDDIYEHMIYDGIKFVSILDVEPSLKDRTLVFNGVSKSFAMTGWRVGFVAGPKDIIKAINKIQSQSTSHTSSISQYAAEEALNGSLDFLAERNATFKTRRDMVVQKMNDIEGITCLTPQGAFYVYPCIKGLIGKKAPNGIIIKTDSDFVEALLESEYVAAVQGEAFGLSPYFRISYATSTEKLEEACARIKKFCEALR